MTTGTEESRKQAEEGLIRKGLLRIKDDMVTVDVELADCNKIIERFIYLKESDRKDAIMNLAFYSLALLNKFVDLTENELMYLVSIALAKGNSFTLFLKKLMS